VEGLPRVKVSIPEAFEPLLTSSRRYRIAIGGRGSGKSMTVAMMALIEVVQGKKILCCREYQNSITDSVHSLLANLITELDLPGFEVTAQKISHTSGGEFIFRGLSRNIESVKSLFGVDVVWIEEAQTISEESLRVLTPTIREAGSYFLMTANPRSQADPFTETFLKGRESILRSEGTFDDELTTIVRVNYDRNPYFPQELDLERKRDQKMLSRAMYEHVWNGETLDEVENSLVLADWFDAALEIGDRLNYRGSGARVVSHDVADTGADAKACVVRHGAKVLHLGLKHDGNASDGLDWALRLVNDYHADSFVYDQDGIGLGLAREVERGLGSRNVSILGFRGGETPRDPDGMYDGHRRNRDAFFNKRAQAYWDLRERFVKTYQAVNGEVHDPDELIFLDREDPLIAQLRSEVCRLPIKPHTAGKIQIYPKTEMAKPPFNLPSPNLGDALMMSFHVQDFVIGSWSQPIEYMESYI
jgi:phage terminase large subunit